MKTILITIVALFLAIAPINAQHRGRGSEGHQQAPAQMRAERPNMAQRAEGRVAVIGRSGRRFLIPEHGRGWYGTMGYYYEGQLFYPVWDPFYWSWGFYYNSVWVSTPQPPGVPCKKEKLKDADGRKHDVLVCQQPDGTYSIVVDGHHNPVHYTPATPPDQE